MGGALFTAAIADRCACADGRTNKIMLPPASVKSSNKKELPGILKLVMLAKLPWVPIFSMRCSGSSQNGTTNL